LYVAFGFKQDLPPVRLSFHRLTFSFYIARQVDKDYTKHDVEAAFPQNWLPKRKNNNKKALRLDFSNPLRRRDIALPFHSDNIFAVALHKHALPCENCQIGFC
jgi:hypothetical protein